MLLRKEAPKPASRATKAERKSKSQAAVAELTPEAVPVFEALRAWRGAQAKEQGVPAYVIFHDATLREIATVRPDSVSGLGGISGLGEKKLATYGEGVLEVLATFGDTPAAPTTPEAAAPAPADPPAPRSRPRVRLGRGAARVRVSAGPGGAADRSTPGPGPPPGGVR